MSIKPSDAILRSGNWSQVTPGSAGWRYLSFRTQTLAAGASTTFGGPGIEAAAVVLGGEGTASLDGNNGPLAGRVDPFGPPAGAAYVPSGITGVVEAGTDLQLAIVSCRSEAPGEPKLISPDDIEIETRGAGSATRRIHHVIPPGFPADRLLVVEVFTPSGNWSSYPPHKHDVQELPRETELEEFYYFRISPEHGFAFQRVYSPERSYDLTAAVGNGDVVLVPFGYHTSAAPHGFDLYYLNGLAGDKRSMAASDDPDLAYIRATWPAMAPDPRSAGWSSGATSRSEGEGK
jgi:5-deoxy-glucuronate isomerase